MMKKYALLMLLPLMGAAACQPTPPPPPPPQTTEITGTVQQMAGPCHVIVADNGAAYSVRPGVLPPNVRPGTRVRLVGVIDPMQNCPGTTLVRADGGVTVLAEGPAVRIVRRGPIVPK